MTAALKKLFLKMTFLNVLLVGIGTAQLIYAGYFFYHIYFIQDHAEHLHAAWLVWNGEVPYRDFFEHHNPLLWYLLAPIVAWFYLNPAILYVSRILSVLSFAVFMGGLFKLCNRFLNISGQAFVLALIFFFGFRQYFGDLFELRPDFFMYAAFVWGNYFYFVYLEERKQRALDTAMLLFTIAFLFLQKILAQEAVIGCHMFYMLVRRKIELRVVLKALVWPAILVSAFLFYLFYTNSYYLYFILNYDLNSWVPAFRWNARLLSDWQMVGMLPAMALVFLPTFDRRKGGVYRQLLVALMLVGLFVNIVIWGPWGHYFIFSNLIAALIIADEFVNNINQLKFKVCLAILLAYLGKVFWTKPLNLNFQSYYQLQKLVMMHTDKDDVIVNGSIVFLNIYNKNPSYYWFGYQNIVPIAYTLYDYDEEPDINRLIYNSMPKFIYEDIYFNEIIKDNVRIMVKKGDKLDYYINYLNELYQKLPVSIKYKDFMQYWTAIEGYKLDLDFISKNYYLSSEYPLFIRKDVKI